MIRQRRQDRTAEHGAISKRAGGSEHRHAEHCRYNNETAAPATLGGVLLVVVQRVRLIVRTILRLVVVGTRGR